MIAVGEDQTLELAVGALQRQKLAAAAGLQRHQGIAGELQRAEDRSAAEIQLGQLVIIAVQGCKAGAAADIQTRQLIPLAVEFRQGVVVAEVQSGECVSAAAQFTHTLKVLDAGEVLDAETGDRYGIDAADGLPLVLRNDAAVAGDDAQRGGDVSAEGGIREGSGKGTVWRNLAIRKTSGDIL